MMADLYNTIYNSTPLPEEKNEFMQLTEEYLSRAEAINENIAIVQKVKALVYLAKNDYDLAYQHFRKAITIDPNHVTSLTDFAWFYERLGLRKHAILNYSKALQLAPLEAIYWTRRAQNYLYHLEEQQKALADLKRALAIDPKQRTALQGYFWYHIRRNEIEEAEAVYKKYRAAYPDSRNLKRFESFLLASRGKRAEALEIELSQYDTMFLYCVLGMDDKAIAELDSFYEKNYLLKNRNAYLQLKNNAFFENIRDHPRFQEILEEHKKIYEENLAKYGDIDI